MIDLVSLHGKPWAITAAAFRALVAGAPREAEARGRIDPAAGQARDIDLCVSPDGVALIPVGGVLVPACGGWGGDEWAWFGYCTGYDALGAQLAAAIDSADVRAIAFVIDSPGGAVAGCFDLVDRIFAARGAKPIWAILNENACSAAYAIASACDRITVPRTGVAGSIGVVADYSEMSRLLDQAGITVNLIHFGARKIEGDPTQPLADDARARIQALVDQLGELFVAAVARNRGLSADAVRATEAAVYLGADGVAAGLADAVLSPAAAYAALIATMGTQA